MTQTDGLLFDPNTYDPQQFDAETRRLLRATIDFFEGQGKKRLLDDDLKAQWPADFVDFVKREKLFATFLTPSEFADGNPDKRWDGARNAALAEILGFYGLTYWYTEQVTILGLGPVWQSENKDAKLRAADDLDAGRRGGPGQRHPLPGVGGEVLHRQRQRREPGVGIRPARGRGGPGRVRVLRRRQPPRGLPPDRQRRAHADLRQHVPAGELP